MTVPHADESRFSPSLELPTARPPRPHAAKPRATDTLTTRPKAGHSERLVPAQGRRKPRRCQRRGGTNGRRLRGKACPSALPPLTPPPTKGQPAPGGAPSRGQGAQRTRTQPSLSLPRVAPWPGRGARLTPRSEGHVGGHLARRRDTDRPDCAKATGERTRQGTALRSVQSRLQERKRMKRTVKSK